MSYYDKGFNPSASVVNASGGTGKALASAFDGVSKLGVIKEQANDKKAKLDLEKETKAKELANRNSIISGMRKLHPKTTAGLSDDEVYILANKINDVHEDPTNRKMTDIFTAENGDRVGVYDTGKTDANGKRVYENVSFGKAYEWNKSTKGGSKVSSTNSNTGGKSPSLAIGEQQTIERAKERLKKNPNSKAAMDIIKETPAFKQNFKDTSDVPNVGFDLSDNSTAKVAPVKKAKPPLNKKDYAKAKTLNNELNKVIKEYSSSKNPKLLEKAKSIRTQIQALQN